MNKKLILPILLLSLVLVTGCGTKTKKEENKTNTNTTDKSVVKDQIFEGLEFVNVGVSNGIITTVVINNTGVPCEKAKFSMKITDSEGNVLAEEVGEIKETIETGTTKEITTKTNKDLSKAAAIEYSIINE